MDKQTERKSLKPNPALKQLEILVGEWRTRATHPLFPSAMTGHASFGWLEGGALLIMHSEYENPGPPTGMAVFGRDDGVDNYTMLYYDERGVSRIYEVGLEGRQWKMWRASPGFSQRFTGTFSDDSNTIAGLWEKSTDGSNWENDLEVNYTRVR
jgi:hypothetical protein